MLSIAQKAALKQFQANTQAQRSMTMAATGTVGDIPAKVGGYVNTSTKLAAITQNQLLVVNVAIPMRRTY